MKTGEIIRAGENEFYRVQSATPKKVVLKRIGQRTAQAEIERQGLEPRTGADSEAAKPAAKPEAAASESAAGRLILTPEEALHEARQFENTLDEAELGPYPFHSAK
jgi:hypothetical protein